MKNSQQGFANIILIVAIVAIVTVGGYFVLSKKFEPTDSNTPSVTPSATFSNSALDVTSTGTSNSALDVTSTGTPKSEVTKKQVEQKSTYPLSKYLPLSSAELEDLRKLFIERNGSNWSIEFDNFGLIKDIRTSDPNFVPQDESTKYILTDSEKSRWEEFVFKNADFFGIDNPKSFKFEYFTFGGERRLVAVQRFNNSLSFNNGETSGVFLSEYEIPLEVFKSVRTIPKFEVSVSIQHHFWPKATLPLTPRLSKNNIEQRFVGSDYTYQEITPEYPCDPLPDGSGCGDFHGPSAVSHPVKIQSGDLDIKVVPYFFNHNGVGELRLIYLTKLLLPNGWTKFFDAITGEELKSGV